MSDKIVIASKVYAGFQSRSESNSFIVDGKVERKTRNVTLAFTTYYEDNAACRKRQSTIHSWADNTRGGESPGRQPETFDNIPRSGFKISERVTHGGGWNDLNVYWRIVHPGGFEIEISSGNLAKLFQYCTIDHGSIAEECVLGFDKSNGSKVVVLPVNSEIYKSSLISTAIHEAAKIPVKDIQLGDKVTLKNGTSGIFLGKQYLYFMQSIYDASDNISLKKVNKYLIKETQQFQNQKPTTGIVVFATPNIIKAEKNELSGMSKLDAEKQANFRQLIECTLDDTMSKLAVRDIGPSYYSHASHFCFSAEEEAKLVLVSLNTDHVKSEILSKLEYYIKNRYHTTLYDIPGVKNAFVIMRLNNGSFVLFSHFNANPEQKYNYRGSPYIDNVAGYAIKSIDETSIKFMEVNQYHTFRDDDCRRFSTSFRVADIESVYVLKVESAHPYGIVHHSL